MKKSVFATALLGTFGLASAQSTMTIYGILDAGISADNSSAAGSVAKLESGMESGSRFGFKGTEDLGNGLKALFVLEQGIALDTGTLTSGGHLFGRQALVGLGGTFGTVTMGRQYTPIFSAYGSIDPFGNNSAGDINTLFGKNSNFISKDYRMDNSVIYTAPVNLGGFNAAVAYGFGEQAGDSAAQSQVGLSLGYASGPIKAVYAYHAENNANSIVDTDTYKSHFLGATYDFNRVKVHAAFDQTTQGADHKTQSYLLGATVPLGIHSIFADVTYRDNKLLNDANASQIAIGYNHTLSKRTNLYTILGCIINDDNSKVNTQVLGKTVNKVQVGMRHVF
ncbi:porin [Solimicrobium silvestre]|nr:porin [Solimicrobium silvestre]